MHVVGLIPARGGSKAIPRKNLADVAGKPLIAHTIAAALASARLDRTVVSTDSDEIAEVARRYGAEVPFLRPAALARDNTPMVDVVLDALERLGRCDVVVVLQPTSPLRRAQHIDEAVDLLVSTGVDTVVSVCEVPHQFRPDSLMHFVDERLVPLVEGAPTRRQDKPVVYARNGPAVLALRTDSFSERRDLYGGTCQPYPMSLRESLDIDTEDDLELARLILS